MATERATPEQIESDAHHGFVHLQGVLDADEVSRYRDAAARATTSLTPLNEGDPIFTQIVNVWQQDEILRELTLSPRLAALAGQLAGVPLRLWHDHLLVKPPHNGAPTEFHQDAPYWPYLDGQHALSVWVALVDVPVERGCMSFLPGSHTRRGIRATNLADARDLFEAVPDLAWEPRVTVPLRAGDVTFHSGYTAHAASANATAEFRYAHVVIYTDRDTRYSGAPHVCTDGQGIAVGDLLPDALFPPL